MTSRAKSLVASTLETHGLCGDQAELARLAELIVDTLDEANFLTREALNPPCPTDAEYEGRVEESLRCDLAE